MLSFINLNQVLNNLQKEGLNFDLVKNLMI